MCREEREINLSISEQKHCVMMELYVPKQLSDLTSLCGTPRPPTVGCVPRESWIDEWMDG